MNRISGLRRRLSRFSFPHPRTRRTRRRSRAPPEGRGGARPGRPACRARRHARRVGHRPGPDSAAVERRTIRPVRHAAERLQDTRRRNSQMRNRLLAQIRALVAPGVTPDETAIREKLKALRDHDEQTATARRDADAVDEVLDARQQALFRLFEERIERQKLDLLMRARDRAARPAGAPPSRAAGEETARRKPVAQAPSLSGLQWPHGVQNSSHGVRASTGAPGRVGHPLGPPDQAGSRSVLGQAHPHRPERERQVTEAGARSDHANQRQRAQRLFQVRAGSQIPVGIVDPTINALGDGRVGGRAVVDLDAVRKQKQRGWLDPLGYMTGRLPITATRNAHDQGRRGQVHPRVRGSVGRDHSEDGAAGAPELLLAHEGKPQRDQHGRPLRAPGTHPRDQGRQGHVHHRPMNPAVDRGPDVRQSGPLATDCRQLLNGSPRVGASIPQGRRPAACRGSPACRSLHRRGSAVPLSDALRGPWRVQDDRLLETGHGGLNHGRRDQLRRTSDPAAALQDLRDAGARSPGALRAVWFNQPFLADVFHPHQRVVLYGKLELSRTACSSRILNTRSSGPTVTTRASTARLGTGRHRGPAHRPHRADLRKDRHADDQDAAGAGVSGAGAASAGTAGSSPRRRPPARAPHGSAPGAGGRALPAGRHQPRRAERVPLEAHRRLIFEEFFFFQLGILLRRRRSDADRKGRPVVITEEHSRVRTPRAAVQVDRRSEEGRLPRSSAT